MQKNLFVSRSDEITFDENDLIQRFRNILEEFGINDKLIKESKSTDKTSSTKVPSFKIQVPGDLSIPQILREVYISFRKDSLTLTSIEKNKGGKSFLTLKFDSRTILKAEFDYSKNAFRNLGSVAFIIYDFNPENPSALSLIESPVKLNFLIRPETKYLQSLDFITKNYQQYSVLIDDVITEQKYKLGPGFSEQRIITVLKTIVTDFQKAVCFIVDEHSDFYKSSNFEVLKRELSKRNIKLFELSNFVLLNDGLDLTVDFESNVESILEGRTKVFLLTEESYRSLESVISKYRKRGYRVVNSSLILL